MSLYDSVRELPLEIEGYRLTGQEVEVSFLRKTTTVTLFGAGEQGSGEDVTYDAGEHDAFQARGADLPLAGTWTLDSFSHHLAEQQLFAAEPDQHAYLDYRRWAFESAALDLALRQSGTSLGALLGREARPLRFVVSMHLDDPATTDRIRAWLTVDPSLTFKLDATPSWSDDFVAELGMLGCVDAVDFKGQYHGTSVDNPADAALYRRVLEGLPDVWLEDPELTPETIALLDPVADRVTWDAPIHSVDDILALHWAPSSVNIKPSASDRSSVSSPRTTTAPPTRSPPTAVASGSSVSAATTSSSSPRCSIRRRRTMSPRPPTTSVRPPGSRQAR